MATCVAVCPMADTYVSTGGCPTGSRCFTFSDIAICFRDCNSASDCFPGEMCDGEGSCVQVSDDGGVPSTDGGAPADGSVPTDGGALDASAG